MKAHLEKKGAHFEKTEARTTLVEPPPRSAPDSSAIFLDLMIKV